MAAAIRKQSPYKKNSTKTWRRLVTRVSDKPRESLPNVISRSGTTRQYLVRNNCHYTHPDVCLTTSNSGIYTTTYLTAKTEAKQEDRSCEDVHERAMSRDQYSWRGDVADSVLWPHVTQASRTRGGTAGVHGRGEKHEGVLVYHLLSCAIYFVFASLFLSFLRA